MTSETAPGKTVHVGHETLQIPEYFQRVESMPDDPARSIPFVAHNSMTTCFMLMYPIDAETAMPFDKAAALQGIRSSLEEDQGIIEVECGTVRPTKAADATDTAETADAAGAAGTADATEAVGTTGAANATDEYHYIYSIVKTLESDDGVPVGARYVLCMDIESKSQITHVQGYFDERGTADVRETIIYKELSSNNEPSQNGKPNESLLDTWKSDPYDPEYTKGALMNLSESSQYDDRFPEHPLSTARTLARCLVGC